MFGHLETGVYVAAQTLALPLFVESAANAVPSGKGPLKVFGLNLTAVFPKAA